MTSSSYAAQAAKSLAHTIGHDRAATEDANAVDKAAHRADGYAKDAREAADRAAADATAAEEAAKDAQKAAEQAQKAAEDAARKASDKQVNDGAGTGIEGTWYVVDEDSIQVTDAKQLNPCEIKVGFEGPRILRSTRLADLVNALDLKLVAAVLGMHPEGVVIYLDGHADVVRLLEP